MTPDTVHAVMAGQDGVVTLRQALATGMSSTAVDRRVRSGHWRRLHPGVYLRADRQLTRAVRLRAAVFAAGPGAVACGTSAAWWLGLTDRAPEVDAVTIPRARSVTPRPRIRVRRRDLDWADLAAVRGLRVTDLPLTVLEASVELRDGSVLMDRALQRHTTLAVLEMVHDRNRGRRGTTAAAQLLHSAGEGGASEAERMLARLLRAAGLTGWTPHVNSCGYEIDVAFVRSRVAVEVDGWAWHRDVSRSTTTPDARTPWSTQAGRCSASPGTSCGSNPTRFSSRLSRRWPPARDEVGRIRPAFRGRSCRRSRQPDVTDCTPPGRSPTRPAMAD